MYQPEVHDSQIAALVAADPRISHSRLARQLGINRATVAKVRDRLPAPAPGIVVSSLQTSPGLSDAQRQAMAQVVEPLTSLSVRLRLLITDNPLSLSQMAEAVRQTRGTVLDALDALRAEPEFSEENGVYVWRTPDVQPADQVRSDRERARLQERITSAEKKYQHTLQELEQSEKRLQVALALQEHVAPIVLTASRTSEMTEACAILQASDWHVGEAVNPASVNNLNAYNPDIAEKRAGNFFRNGLQLIEKERHSVSIRQAVLWLGGDIITGYIHDELQESNFLSPTQESVLAMNFIAGGLRFLAQESGLERIVVICNYGNHGRIGEKRRISTGAQNSYEWLIYRSLEKEFRAEPRIQFQNATGYINYLEVFGYMLRFHHGDSIGYQGGVGGVTIPLNRWIGRSNEQVRADMDFVGHFHQLTFHRNFTINGSLIGYNAYAQSLGASPERPQQAFRLLDSRRGFTGCFPILVQDDDERDLWQPGFERLVA